jgi:transposase
MRHSTAPASRMTIGLDVSDRFSYFYTLDPLGECVEDGRVATSVEAIRRRFGSIPPARIALETGTHSPWISRVLRGCGHEVIVANARQLRFIFAKHNKTDPSDAQDLARTARLDPRLLHPVQHRSREDQASLAVLRARNSVVDARTQLVLHVRGSVKSFGARIPACSCQAFHGIARKALPPELHPALLPVLEAIETLTKRIREYDQVIEKDLCAKKYPVTAVLRQVEGVGPITALAYVLVLGDPRRFKSSRTVGAYLGLTPRRADSGDCTPQLRITKAGDGFLRRLLVGSAHYILGPFGSDSDLRRFGMAISRRGGKNAKKRAVAAVARKLAVLLHHLWITGEVYEPLRQTRSTKAS